MVSLCPVCDEALLIVEFRGIEVDFCGRCHGIWLDEGELELLSAAREDDPLVQAHRVGPSDAEPAVDTRARRRRRCPRCSRPIEGIVMGRDPKLHLDRCTQGHGLWFDAGELRQLLRQFGTDAGPSVQLLDELFASSEQPDGATEG
jgi:Zn-finger nucleic acid-binding protein